MVFQASRQRCERPRRHPTISFVRGTSWYLRNTNGPERGGVRGKVSARPWCRMRLDMRLTKIVADDQRRSYLD